MLRHQVEYALCKEFQGRWLKDDTGNRCLSVIVRTDTMADREPFLRRHPEAFPLIAGDLEKVIGNVVHFDVPNANTRYLCLQIRDTEDEGEFLLTDSLSREFGRFDEIVSHPGFLSELDDKLDHSLRFLATPPVNWFMEFPRIDDRVIDLILDDERLYYTRAAASQVMGSFYVAGFREFVPIGVWALMWSRGEATFPCGNCGGRVYVFTASRALSMGSRTGVCGGCGNIVSERSTEGPLEIREMMRTLPEPKVRPFRIDRAVEVIRSAIGIHLEPTQGRR